MEKFIIYCLLIALYVISFLLERKYDASKRRMIFIIFWTICMVVVCVYPFLLPGWWKALYLVSGFVTITSLFLDSTEDVLDDTINDWIPGKDN